MSDRNSWFILLTGSCIWPLTIAMALVERALKGNNTTAVNPSFSSMGQPPQYRSTLGSSALPLGYLLKKAGLISDVQIKMALTQQTSQPHLKIGEIIADYGWLQPETIDFFVEDLPQIHRLPKQPLGQYLKQAKLLDEQQIQDILATQQQTPGKFGEVAVEKGWVKPETIALILRYLKG